MPGHADYFQFASPWSTSHLEMIAFRDTFGDIPITNRAAAMAIPAIARSRNLLVTQAAKRPLVELEGDTRVADQPNWITQCGDGSSPFQRALWSYDDLIWYPATCWWREDSGKPTETRSHINYDDWEINTDKRCIRVNGEDVPDEKVILIPGPHEGVLTFGRTALQDITNLYRIVSERIKYPQPETELHDTEGNLPKEEREELLKGARESRQQPGGASFFYTSKRIESKPGKGDGDSALMIDARNAAAVDGARMIGLHAGMIDATAPKASLNYETQQGRGLEFYDFDLDPFVLCLTARLSMDDVCAPGRRIAGDNTEYTAPAQPATGPSLED